MASPASALFGQPVTPNLHKLALDFVTLDNFMDTAEVSFDGWLWSTSAQAPDVVQKEWPVAYAYRGLGVESEGLNRNVNVAIPTVSRAYRRRSFFTRLIRMCCRARRTLRRRMDRTMN